MRPLSTLLFLSSVVLASFAMYVGHQRPGVNYQYVGDCVARETAAQRTHDQHQALVNALYACGVWKVPVG